MPGAPLERSPSPRKLDLSSSGMSAVVLDRELPDPPRPRPDWALFLDFDGTLVGFAPRPDEVRPAPGLVSVLDRAAESFDRALAVITGRPIAEIDHWLDSSVVAVAGIHGAERRSADGRWTSLPAGTERPRVMEEAMRARVRLRAVADANEGVYFEDKGHCFALHFRTVPDRKEVCVAAVRALESAAFEALVGFAVAELRVRGVHKGAAVAAFMAEPPFAGRIPVFVGDDATDEDGFRAVNAMGGVSVLAGSSRPSAARHRLSGVAGVFAWLEDVPGALAR